jgi:hypothetical protein
VLIISEGGMGDFLSPFCWTVVSLLFGFGGLLVLLAAATLGIFASGVLR